MSKFNVYIDTTICKGCNLCVFYCKQGVLKLSDKLNAKGYNVSTAVNPDACIGCKMCEKGCPDLAIFVEKNA